MIINQDSLSFIIQFVKLYGYLIFIVLLLTNVIKLQNIVHEIALNKPFCLLYASNRKYIF